MDWKSLFFSANGRIGRKDFWVGVAILFAANLLLGFIPILGMLLHIATIYAWVCLSAKRLHDMGQTGWLTAAPYGVWAIALALAAAAGGTALIAATASGSNAAIGAAALGAMGLASLILLVAFLINLAFLLWLGLAAPNAAENRYGAPPGPLVTGL